jgi:PmbA protein
MNNYQSWLDLGQAKGLSDLQIFISTSASTKVVVYEGQVEQNTISNVTGVTIKGVFEDKLSSVHFEHISNDTIEAMLDQVIENAKALTVKEPAIIYEGSPSYPEVKEHLFDFSSVPMKDKIDALLHIEQQLKKHKEVSNVQTTVYQENISKTMLLNTKGLSLTRENHLAYVYAIGVFQQKEDIVTAMDLQVFHDYESFDPNQLVLTIIKRGQQKLGGSSLPTKEYPVVFSNEMFADILGVFQSLFSAESAYRNLTPWKDKVGQKVAHEMFQLNDDPLHQDAYFQMPFDDEGVACYEKDIVKDGVFKGFLHDLKTASLFNETPTGNSFSGRIQTTNLYLKPTNTTFDEMISSIDEGVYITDLIGLHAGVKTVSGEFSLQASGLKIDHGTLTSAVKMIVVSGNFFKMIENLKGIANDLKFDVSGVGSPSVYAGLLSISGETQ